jgi:hypothetical protein
MSHLKEAAKLIEEATAARTRQSVARYVPRQDRSGPARRRSTSTINWSEWIFTEKENGHETAN